jgi:uncharacterized membrane protein YjfL (UPF0719 family)
VATTYASFRIVVRITRGAGYLDALKTNKMATGILTGGTMLATGLIVKTSTQPAMSALQVFLFHEFTWVSLGKFLALLAGYVLASLTLANIAIWAGMKSFLWLTFDLDELAEVERNNVAVAMTLAITLIVMGLFIADGLSSLLQALVPVPVYQAVEVFRG